MSYQITHFDSVALPLANLKQDRGTPEVPSPLRRYIGGVADVAGANQQYPDIAQIALTGTYYGEPGALINQAGVYLATQAGDHISVGSATNRLRSQLEDLNAKLGVRGQLWRTLADTGTRQWKYARLLRAAHVGKVESHLIRAELQLLFETYQPAWCSASLVTATGNAGTPLIASIGGNVNVRDAILAITAGATISSITITGVGISLQWTGTLTSGQILRIDSGLRTVRIGSATNAYSGFTVASGHTSDRWLDLPPGLNTLHVRTNGNVAATLSLTYYDQWL
jgi:hypothetical protein